jgi:hypothetical protein
MSASTTLQSPAGTPRDPTIASVLGTASEGAERFGDGSMAWSLASHRRYVRSLLTERGASARRLVREAAGPPAESLLGARGCSGDEVG